MAPANLIGAEGFARVARARHGYFLYNKHDIYIGRSIAVYGEYSEGEVALFQQICGPSDVVVEVGANIGAHTVPLARMVESGGFVCAFEPQRIVFQNLCANVALNSLLNVRCYEMALAAERGHAHVESIRYDADGNFGGIALSATPTESSSPRHTAPLDEIVDLTRLRLLKVDVEGMEADVLRGAARTIQRTRPLIYAENDRPELSEELINLIVGMGYRMYWHVVPLHSAHNHAQVSENLFPGITSINVLAVPEETDARVVGLIPVSDASDHPLSDGTRLRSMRSSICHYSEPKESL
jgi:FkbM family methyltransferase